MLYFIMQCFELGDQYECDADRTPLCLTEDPNQYGLGYEVYQVNSDNTLTLIKDYDTELESGMALYWWNDNNNDDERLPQVIIEKWKDLGRDDVSKSQIKKIKKQAGFHDTIEEILNDIYCVGSHGETIDGKWIVFGEYADDRYSLGY